MIKNEILDVSVTNNGIYIIERTQNGKVMLCCYGIKSGMFGGLTGTQVWNDIPEYERMQATEDEVIFFSPQSITVYRKNQSLKYEGDFDRALEAVFPAGKNRYFLVDTGKIQLVKLTGKKQEEGE